VPTDLKQWDSNDVDSPGFLDVRLDGSTTHYLIFTGIAKPEFRIDDDGNIDREEVSVDLGVDVTDVLGYTATVGLASIQNDDSSFVFATDSVRLDSPGGRLFLRTDIAVSGDNSAVHRFSYQAHVRAVIAEPLISGTIRWENGIESHSRPVGLFTVTANLKHQDPGQIGPSFEKVADGDIAAATLNGSTWEATYSIMNPPLHQDLYVIATNVEGAFVAEPGYDLLVEPAFSGPYNLSGSNPSATGVDFEMVATPAPR
jgi:hypothetical protein